MMKSALGPITEQDIFNVSRSIATLCYGAQPPFRPENFEIEYHTTPLSLRFAVRTACPRGWIATDIQSFLERSGFMTVTVEASTDNNAWRDVTIHGHSLEGFAKKLANAHEKALQQRRDLLNVVSFAKSPFNHDARPSI